jgi:hypothetical protein
MIVDAEVRTTPGRNLDSGAGWDEMSCDYYRVAVGSRRALRAI